MLQTNSTRETRLYDLRVTFQSIEIGDRVLFRNLGLSGKHKLESKWSPDPYVIVGKMPNLPVFKIKRVDGSLGTKTMHRDHLLPIEQLVRMPPSTQDADPPARPKTRADTRKKSQRPETQELQVFSDSSSDMEYYVTHRVTWRDPLLRMTNTARPVVDLEVDPEPENDNDSETDNDPETEHDPKAEPVHENDSDPEDDDHNSETEPEEEKCDQDVALEETSEVIKVQEDGEAQI